MCILLKEKSDINDIWHVLIIFMALLSVRYDCYATKLVVVLLKLQKNRQQMDSIHCFSHNKAPAENRSGQEGKYI